VVCGEVEIFSASRNQTFTCCHRLPRIFEFKQQWLLSTQVAVELEPLHIRAFFPLWNIALSPFVPFVND
jgi:hypothetical protein